MNAVEEDNPRRTDGAARRFVREREEMFGLLGRRSIMLGLLVASVAIPYLGSHPQVRAQLETAWRAGWGGSGGKGESKPGWRLPFAEVAAPALPNPTAPPALGSVPGLQDLPGSLAGPATRDFGQVINYGVTPDWVLANWSRVTTVLAEHNLEGLRVAFVSGTGIDDLAGVLTYYYDTERRLQRIAFQGHTGDARRLETFVQQSFGLRSEPGLYAGLWLTKWNGQPKSALLIHHAPVVVSASSHARLEVLLELNRPDAPFTLSPILQEQLRQGRETSRWGSGPRGAPADARLALP